MLEILEEVLFKFLKGAVGGLAEWQLEFEVVENKADSEGFGVRIIFNHFVSHQFKSQRRRVHDKLVKSIGIKVLYEPQEVREISIVEVCNDISGESFYSMSKHVFRLSHYFQHWRQYSRDEDGCMDSFWADEVMSKDKAFLSLVCS